MAFNKQDFLELVKDTLGTIALNQSSILDEAETKLKAFLEQNTSITDNEKAQVYSQFLTQVVTNSINSVLQSSTDILLNNSKIEQEIISMQINDDIKQAQSDKDLAVKDEQINLLKVQQDEINQKISSMKTDDDIKKAQSNKDLAVKDQQITSMKAKDEIEKNRVAGELTKIKYEIEHLLPAQVDNLQKDLQIKDKELEIRSEDIELKKAQISLENKQVEMTQAEIQIKKSQLQLQQQDIQLKQAQLPLVQAQAKAEEAKAFLLDQQGITEQYNQSLVKANAEQIKENIEKIKKEEELLDYQKDLTNAERNLKDQQAVAVLKALDVNQEIEKCKCETQLKVTAMQVQSL